MRETGASSLSSLGHSTGPRAAPPVKGKIAASVALSLLEVIQARDLPGEILESENPAQTMPRRLGLSGVVDVQIQRLRQQARRRERLHEDQVRDLFHLVLRRPDSEEVFFQAGQRLAGKTKRPLGIVRLLPQRVLFSLARRQLEKRIRALFSRPVGSFVRGTFLLEARGHFLLEMDPGGDACHLMSGLAQTMLQRYIGRDVVVSHPACQALKHELCQWSASE